MQRKIVEHSLEIANISFSQMTGLGWSFMVVTFLLFCILWICINPRTERY